MNYTYILEHQFASLQVNLQYTKSNIVEKALTTHVVNWRPEWGTPVTHVHQPAKNPVGKMPGVQEILVALEEGKSGVSWERRLNKTLKLKEPTFRNGKDIGKEEKMSLPLM